VGASFPALLPRYERAYPATYAPRDYQARLEERLSRLRARYGFDEDAMRERRLVPDAAPREVWPPRASGGQLALPL
jgi:hypothetical protein